MHDGITIAGRIVLKRTGCFIVDNGVVLKRTGCFSVVDDCGIVNIAVKIIVRIVTRKSVHILEQKLGISR